MRLWILLGTLVRSGAVQQAQPPTTTRFNFFQNPAMMPAAVQRAIPATTASTTTPAALPHLLVDHYSPHTIQKDEKISDFFQAVEKEAEDEFSAGAEKNKATQGKTAAEVATAAVMGEANSYWETNTRSTTQAAVHLQELEDLEEKKVAQDTKDLEEKKTALIEAEREQEQVSVDLERIQSLTTRTEQEVNKTQDDMDMTLADGKEIDAALEKRAADAKDAKARVEKLVEEKKALVQPAQLRVADAKAAVIFARTKLYNDRAMPAAA